ncbi:MAG TPA: endopeptidase La, partial [Myxococcales bacterium]|nr:endopeptidase La [Myxococcales bacterium]
MQTKETKTVPAHPFPIMPLRNGILFPGSMITLSVGRKRSTQLIEELTPGAEFGVMVQLQPETENPQLEDLHPIGTWARLHRIVKRPDHYRVTVEGLFRITIDELVEDQPYWMAKGAAAIEHNEHSSRTKDLAQLLRKELLQALEQAPAQFGMADDIPESPGLLADAMIARLGLPTEEELDYYLTLDLEERLEKVLSLLTHLKARMDVKQSIEGEIQQNMAKNHREALLREQLRAIKKELGEEESQELQPIKEWLENTTLPEEVEKVVMRELSRVEKMSKNQAEYNVILNYLEWMKALPWDDRVEVLKDLDNVSEQLDADHFGLQDIKKRILEHMAFSQVSEKARGTILCFAGPPGVGKTSLAQSIADATGRPLARIALGGIRDEAEMRGHRRTYVGALPGRIIHALKKVGVKNPVILLDEIDKLSRSWNGDPEAALLEVLDPEQNATFTDHYIEQPFDLSEVLFICTANDLSQMSAPLRDRLDIIELSGYTSEEKQAIARHHLLPKQAKEHGMTGQVSLSDEALQSMIQHYTREAGVRQLNREIQKLFRSLTLEFVRNKDSKPPKMLIDAPDLKEHIGKPRFFDQVSERTATPGVAVGLAWTPVGGDILFIETTKMQGKGHLEITGKLGDVMQESVKAA